MEDKLAFFGCSIFEVNFEVAARPHTDALGAIILAQLNTIHELRLNLNLANQLHLKVSDFLCIESLATIIFPVSGGCDLDELGHASDISALDVAHNTEETFQVIHFAPRHHEVRIVALTLNSNLLSDQGHSIELHRRHHFFCLPIEE